MVVGPTAERRRRFRRALTHSQLTVLIAACSAGPAPDDLATVVRDSAGIIIVENRLGDPPAICPVRERLRIGTATGAPEYELYRVFGNTRLSGGETALITNNEVRLYRPDGSFRLAFGGTGGGPGEFPGTAITLDAIRGDTVVIGHEPPWRFSYFAPDGRYLSTVEPETQILRIIRGGVFPDGRVLIGTTCCEPTRRLEFVDQELILMVMDRSGGLDTLGIFPFRRWGLLLDGSEGAARFRAGPLFGHAADAQPTPNGFVYAPGDRAEIQLWSLGGRLERIVRWMPGPPSVTPDDILAYRESLSFGRAASATRRALVGSDRPVAENFPAHSGVRVADSGEIWTLLYPLPGETDTLRTWLVFEPDGRFRCQLQVSRLENPKVGRDHIRGALRDELGVEYVVEFVIAEPASS